MGIQISAIGRTAGTVPLLLAEKRRRDRLLFVVILVTMLSLTPLLIIAGVTIGISPLLGGLVALVVATAVVRWPVVGFYAIAGCVVLIEQFPLPDAFVTGELNVFYWPPALEGLIERPIGFFFIFIFLVFICHRLVTRQRILRGGKLLLPFLFYLICVAIGVLHGLTSGGSLKIIVIEVRPFWYLFLSYLLAYNLVRHKNQVRTFFWIVILGAFVKSLQGVYIYLVILHGKIDSQHAIMSHEESFFFVAVILLLMLFCLHLCYRPQLCAVLLVMPCLLIALVANQRRTDYIALAVGVVVSWIIIFWIKPQARKSLIIGVLACVLLSVGYIIAFSHSTGAFAAPARGVVSLFTPDPSDTVAADSNLYRSIENYDLIYTALQNPLLGWGFGKKFLQPVVLPDISAVDANYDYIPHNTIYWVWMRLGIIGFFALWCLLGSIIVRGCLIARRLRNPYLQLVAMYTVAATFMEIIVAFADYQLFFYRNVIYLGLLAGILMRLPALDEKKEVPAHEPTHGIP